MNMFDLLSYLKTYTIGREGTYFLRIYGIFLKIRYWATKIL